MKYHYEVDEMGGFFSLLEDDEVDKYYGSGGIWTYHDSPEESFWAKRPGERLPVEDLIFIFFRKPKDWCEEE